MSSKIIDESACIVAISNPDANVLARRERDGLSQGGFLRADHELVGTRRRVQKKQARAVPLLITDDDVTVFWC